MTDNDGINVPPFTTSSVEPEPLLFLTYQGPPAPKEPETP